MLRPMPWHEHEVFVPVGAVGAEQEATSVVTPLVVWVHLLLTHEHEVTVFVPVGAAVVGGAVVAGAWVVVAGAWVVVAGALVVVAGALVVGGAVVAGALVVILAAVAGGGYSNFG